MRPLKNKHWYLALILIMIVSQYSHAQKKQLKKNGITYVVVMNKKNKEDKPYKQSEKRLNNKGEITEEIGYKSDGTIATKIVYEYNKFSQLTQKTEYETIKNVDSTALKIKERRAYIYNGFDELSEETIYNHKNEIEKKITYSYNRKGLMTEKKTLDSTNNVINIKTYLYK
jgi:hypothetical protein